MNRYILEEARTQNGTRVPIRILYIGDVLTRLNFAQIVEDRRKVFGKEWANCIPSGTSETLVFTLSKPTFRRLFKSDIR